MVASEPVIHPTYLPFTDAELLGYFAAVAQRSGAQEAERHLTYYRQSVARLRAFEAGPKPTGKDARTVTRRARQIEKDERFWVAAALMAVFHAEARTRGLVELLRTALVHESGPLQPAARLMHIIDKVAEDTGLRDQALANDFEDFKRGKNAWSSAPR